MMISQTVRQLSRRQTNKETNRHTHTQTDTLKTYYTSLHSAGTGRKVVPAHLKPAALAFHHLNKKLMQLSHRDRATLRVIEYFAKSFKVTHSK